MKPPLSHDVNHISHSWVHMVCSLYIPGVEYVEPEILSGVSLDQVPANKWGARVSCD